MELEHRPVLLDEVLRALNLRPAGLYLDGTYGRGGHSAEILRHLDKAGRLLAMDRDPQAVAAARRRFVEESRFAVVRGSFTLLGDEMVKRGWLGRVDGLLLDLGVSSPQLDEPQRGFSFSHDGPLDMRMDPDAGVSAAVWLAEAQETEIAGVLREYGEERYARRIAGAIVRQRKVEPITTTAMLARIVAQANPSWERGKNPATRIFQAIRIFINAELSELARVLEQSLEILAPGGRLVVISFHSLEDRMVKRFIRNAARGGELPPDLPVREEQIKRQLRRVGGAIRATATEVRSNPRARSAVLRVAERLA